MQQITILKNKTETLKGLQSELKYIKADHDTEIICPLCSFIGNLNFTYPKKEIAEDLYREGWRYCSSEHYALEGYLCPDCSQEKTPESKGEY